MGFNTLVLPVYIDHLKLKHSIKPIVYNCIYLRVLCHTVPTDHIILLKCLFASNLVNLSHFLNNVFRQWFFQQENRLLHGQTDSDRQRHKYTEQVQREKARGRKTACRQVPYWKMAVESYIIRNQLEINQSINQQRQSINRNIKEIHLASCY